MLISRFEEIKMLED
jgi:hypothetical protein